MVSKDEVLKLINEADLSIDELCDIVNLASAKLLNNQNITIISEAGGVTIFKTQDLYIAIQPDQGRNFEKSGYFKVSWQPNFKDNSKVARISMIEPKYIYHINDGVILDSKINLNYILNLPAAIQRYPKAKTVWDTLVYAIAEICNVNYDDIKNIYKNIPDYSNLKADPKRSPSKWKRG